MEVLYNITLALVNVLGKIQLKIFLSALLQIAEKQKQEKTYDKAAKPRCVFCLIIKVAKQGKRSPKNSCSTALKGK